MSYAFIRDRVADFPIQVMEVTESIGARDALERNLMHQAMVAQELGMAMAAKAHRLTAMVGGLVPEAIRLTQGLEAARMAKAAAGLFEASQDAMLTFARLCHGGRQVVTVQYVTLGAGGQAVVAGSVKPKRQRR